jgi:hypothetical protein
VDSGDNQWKTFVAALVHHSLASSTAHIKYYEIWNEPDLLGNWSGTPAQLVTLAKDAYTIIHELDPNALVVGPGPSTANRFGVHFLPDYYAAGGASPQDIVALHAYLYEGSDYSANARGMTTSIDQLRSLMTSFGVSSKPIFFTEGSWGNSTALTDDQKVAYLAQQYILMWSKDVSRYYWYAWDNTRNFGTLWDATSGVHPAGIAYGFLAGWLVGSVHGDQPCSQSADATWTCTLTLADGNPAEIVWNPSASTALTVGTKFTTYRTLTNNTVNSIIGDTVTVENKPILLR